MSGFQDLGYLIKLISDNMLKIINRSISQFGLTFQQFQIIEYIINQENDVSQKDIENHLGVAHPTVVGLLKRMEIKNFIVCKFNPDDKRVKNVYLTKKAYKIMEQVSLEKKQIENQICFGICDKQRDALLSSLNTLLENLNK
ncbi:MAG: MarR family transcriptional regulator [Ruminococcus sp.]|nr:MarR family transcriptional regulator [Ruminococcus sp.]